MKKILLYSISIITCLYFLSSGNIQLFSKWKKNYVVEAMDLDKDADDKSDESEKTDSKENYNEENFLTENHLLLPTNTDLFFTFSFAENEFQIYNRALEIISPPPQA